MPTDCTSHQINEKQREKNNTVEYYYGVCVMKGNPKWESAEIVETTTSTTTKAEQTESKEQSFTTTQPSSTTTNKSGAAKPQLGCAVFAVLIVSAKALLV